MLNLQIAPHLASYLGGSKKFKEVEICVICDVVYVTGMIPTMLFTVRETVGGGFI